MTRVSNLGQFDLTSLLPGPVRQTVQDAARVASNPIAGALKSVTFWSAFSPPKSYTGTQLDEIYRDPTPNPYLQMLQPVIIVDTVIGKQVIAPYGIPAQDAWEANTKKVGIGGAVLAGAGVLTVLIVGAALGRVRRKA